MAEKIIQPVSLQGLTDQQAQERRKKGDGNNYKPPSSRTVADIVRGNVLNPINIVLFVIGFMLVFIGRPGDAFVTVGIVFVNIVVGMVQEIRAKRKLDQIALLTRPKVKIIRGGKEIETDPSEIVLGDLVLIEAGDQLVIDGKIVDNGRVELDESQLTGESDIITKGRDDEVFSGSVCNSGRAICVATAVGKNAFANKVTSQARAYKTEYTPLQRNVNFLINLLALLALAIGFIMLISALVHDIPAVRSVQATAVLAGLIPSGLFAMVIVAYSLGALRVAGKGALVQRANAVESLSNVEILCIDKTGTLTANRIRYNDLTPLTAEKEDVERRLAAFAHSATTTNKTSQAIVDTLEGVKYTAVQEVEFSSARKWSAISFDDDGLRGSYVLGALEMINQAIDYDLDQHHEQLIALSDQGLRVLMFAHSDNTTLYDGDTPALPRDLTPLAFVTFTDELRNGVQQTLSDFRSANIQIKVISGDNPDTVAALAKQAGFPPNIETVSGIYLSTLSQPEFDAIALKSTIFGRITPEQKEALVDSLRRQGNYVAMIGDGVNDVLSLKKANLGIAMQSGTSATRSVADIVLMNDSFSTLPQTFIEGQRIVNGLRDTFKIFASRSFFVIFTIIAVGVIGMGFPYVPKHTSLAATVAAALPSFALTFIAQKGRLKKNLLDDVFGFVLTTSALTALFGFLLYVGTFELIFTGTIDLQYTEAYVITYQDYAGIAYEIPDQASFSFELAVFAAQTALTVFTLITSLIITMFVAPPFKWLAVHTEVRADNRIFVIWVVMLLTYVGVFAIEPLHRFFELVPLGEIGYIIVTVWALICGAVIYAVLRYKLLQSLLTR